MKRPSYFPSWKGIWAYLLDKQSSVPPKILLVFAILYLLFPFDLIPDLAVFIGWLDDLGLNVLALWYVFRKAKEHEERNRLRRVSAEPDRDKKNV